jgi:hypothetical protein
MILNLLKIAGLLQQLKKNEKRKIEKKRKERKTPSAHSRETALSRAIFPLTAWFLWSIIGGFFFCFVTR